MKNLVCTLALVFTASLAFGQKVISSAIGSGGATTTVDGKYYSQIIGQLTNDLRIIFSVYC
ncbi:MAG: hypothetical protein ACKOUQ_13410, partial [Aquirufa sp.]